MDMDARMKRYKQLSPERAKVWKEKSPKFQQVRRVPVVYYLCRNNQLEHPHFMEVPVSSPEGLYLRDVIARLNVLRGRGMVTMYSWSCKRSYKNGFVWHDLCENDIVLPASGNEYVLKGSEIFEESSSDQFIPAGKVKIQNLKQLPQPASSRSQDDSSSSSSMNAQRREHSAEHEVSPSARKSGSSDASKSEKDSPRNSSLSLAECKIHKSEGLANASTQTEGSASRFKTQETCSRGVSTDEITGTVDSVSRESCHSGNESSDRCTQSVSTPPSSCSASSSGGKTETLESLIRADAKKMNSFRTLEEDETQPSNAKLKATNMLMQLISCGTISVKDHSLGIVSGYRSGLSDSRFPSPLYSSRLLGELDFLEQDRKLVGLTLKDKEYFSGSLVETKMLKEGGGHAVLKRSSSYNADRTCKQFGSAEDQGEPSSGHTKCIPRAIKVSLSKQPRSESMRSPLYDKPRKSSCACDRSNGSSKRITIPISLKNSSNRVDSFRDEAKVIKIEESLLLELGL